MQARRLARRIVADGHTVSVRGFGAEFGEGELFALDRVDGIGSVFIK